MMRTKLDALQVRKVRNGDRRDRYEITHAPMDVDLTPTSRPYFQILRELRADLDFLMPQFYNGVTRPAYGVDGSGGGEMSAAELFGSLSDDLFENEPHKVNSPFFYRQICFLNPSHKKCHTTSLPLTGCIWTLHIGLLRYRFEHQCCTNCSGHVRPEGDQRWGISVQWRSLLLGSEHRLWGHLVGPRCCRSE